MRYVTRTSALALLIALLAACGGGGSGGGSGAPSTPPPPTDPGGGQNPPPSNLSPMRLMPQGYQEAVRSVGPLVDLTMWLGQLAVASFSELASSGGSQTSEPCDQGGQVSINLADNDSSGRVSASDRLVVRYTNCTFDSVTTEAVINVDVASMTEEAAQNVVDLRLAIESFTMREGGSTTTISGGVNNVWTTRARSDRFVLTGTRVAIGGAGRPERLENFAIDLTHDYSMYEYRLTWRGAVQSEVLAASFTFETDAVMLGQFGRYPEAGAWTIYGDRSAVRLEEGAGGETSSTQVGIAPDFDGDGIFEPSQVSLLWLEGFGAEMFVGYRSGSTPPADIPTIHVIRGRVVPLVSEPLSESSSDIVVDSTRNALYVSSPANNEVVAVSTSTYHITDRIPVGATPTDLYLPADRSELIVALNRGGALARVNPDTRQFTRLETAVANNSSAPVTVVGAGDAVYVTAFPSVADGGQLPSYVARATRSTSVVERLPDPVVPNVRAPVELSADGRYLYTAERVGSGMRFVKRDMSLPAAPIVASREFTDMLEQSFALNPDGQTLVLERGHVLRTSDFAQIATVTVHDAIAFNDDGSRMLTMSAHVMRLYDSRKYITLRTLWPDCALTASDRKLAYVAIYDQWVAKYDNKICAVSIDDRLNPPGQPGGPLPPPQLQPVTLPATVQTIFTPLNQNGLPILAAEIDRQRGVLYLGGMRNMAGEVAVVSLADLSTLATIPLPSNREPLSLALNDARDRLYVNQDGDGHRLEVIDTTNATRLAPLTYSSTLFGTGYGLSHAAWIGNDKLLMATRSNGESVTMATLDVQTGAGNLIAGGAARFRPGLKLIVSPDRTSAFTNGFVSTVGGSLERIDLTQSNPTVAMTRVNQELNGATLGTFNAAGTLLYFEGGIVVNPQTMMLAGFTAEGMQIPTQDGSTVYVLDTISQSLRVFDAPTYRLRALYSFSGCFGMNTFAQIGTDDKDIVFTVGAGVCRIRVP